MTESIMSVVIRPCTDPMKSGSVSGSGRNSDSQICLFRGVISYQKPHHLSLTVLRPYKDGATLKNTV